MKADQDNKKLNIQNFMNDRFGLFIHFGLYAIPSRDVLAISRDPALHVKYIEYFNEFNPVEYNPAIWAKAAKEAGMQYAVFCAKQHDGFCLWDSALTDFKATNTKAGRDLFKEYVEAFRSEGLKIGFYYSLVDWHHHDFPHYGDYMHPFRKNEAYKNIKHDFDNYLNYMHGQIRELCSNYGKIDILWVDYSIEDKWGETWRATDLVKMVRDLQPGIVINNRLDGNAGDMGSILSENPAFYAGDFASLEFIIPPSVLKNKNGAPVPWESCMPINDSWGFVAADKNYKSARFIIRKLVECVSKGGNLLVNIGPDPRGNFPTEAMTILKEIGAWMKHNKASVIGCGSAEHPKPEWGWFTQNGRFLYAHVFESTLGPHHLPVDPRNIKKVRLLAHNSELVTLIPWNAKMYPGYSFVDLWHGGQSLCALPDDIDTVLEIELRACEG